MNKCSEYSSDSGYTWVLDMPLKTRGYSWKDDETTFSLKVLDLCIVLD